MSLFNVTLQRTFLGHPVEKNAQKTHKIEGKVNENILLENNPTESSDAE